MKRGMLRLPLRFILCLGSAACADSAIPLLSNPKNLVVGQDVVADTPLLDKALENADMKASAFLRVIGGCQAITLGTDAHLDGRIATACNHIPVPPLVSGSQPWTHALRVTSQDLVADILLAQKLACKKTACFSNKSHFTVLIVPDALPSVFGQRIALKGGSIVVVLQLGLLEMVDESTDALLLTDYRSYQPTYSDDDVEYHLAEIFIEVPDGASVDVERKKKAKAERALNEVRGGVPFSKVASENSDAVNSSGGGDLGWRRISQLPNVIADQLPNIDKVGLSGVFRVPAGYLIFKLIEKRFPKSHAILGLDYDQWIAAWTKHGVGPKISAPKGGALSAVDAIDLSKSFGPDSEMMNRYVDNFRGTIMMVNTFIFGHEMAHLVDGEDCGTKSIDPVVVEMACDRIAFDRTFMAEPGSPLVFPKYVVHWMVAMHYFDNLVGGTLRVTPESKPFADQGGLLSMYPGRIWLRRAGAIVDREEEILASLPLDADQKAKANQSITGLRSLIQNSEASVSGVAK